MTYKGRAPFQSAAFTETQRNFTYFDKSLTTALTDVIIESPGDFLYIDQASTGVVRVELNMRQGGSLAPITLAAGGSIECDFSSVKITADAQLNKTVRIVIGNGARIKGGANVNAASMAVTVVDGGLVRTLASQAFIAACSMTAAGGEYPNLGLSNPVGSGKNCFVEAISVSTQIAQNIVIGAAAAGFGSEMGAAYVQNKYFGQADGVCTSRYLSAAGGVATSTPFLMNSAANTTKDLIFSEPLLLVPGQAVVAYGATAASALFANFEYYEQ